jgi:N-acetyl-alpha-D-muramate 1-phosphate uridylyltransferase
MILAAGRGERMRPLTDTCPKPLLEVGGKALIVWQIERLVAAGVTDIVINHAHLGAQIEASLGSGQQFGARIQYSAEPAGALETAGGVAKALPLLGDEAFILVSGDIYTDCDFRILRDALDTLKRHDAMAWLLMVDNPPFHPKGDFTLLPDGHLSDSGMPRLTYSNLGLFSPQFFASVASGERKPMLPLFREAMSRQRLYGERYTGTWHNLGTPQQLQALDQELRSRKLV